MKTMSFILTGCVGLFVASCASQTSQSVDYNGDKTVSSSGKYPFGVAVPSKKGYVFSPYNQKIVDVRGIPANQLVQDPTFPTSSKKYFRVPLEACSKYEDSVYANAGSTGNSTKPSQSFKEGAGAVLGFIADLGLATTQAISENPELISSLSGNRGGSSYNNPSQTMLATKLPASTVSANSNDARSNTSAPINVFDATTGQRTNTNSTNGSPTQSAGSNQRIDTSMRGVENLGAASGPVSVSFRAADPARGNAIVHSSVANKYGWVIARGVVSGYGKRFDGSTSNLKTENFEIMFNGKGPYVLNNRVFFTNGNWDFSRGLKLVKINSVNYIR